MHKPKPTRKDKNKILYMDKVFKNGPSKIYGRQPLKHLKRYGNFTWYILEYLVSCVQSWQERQQNESTSHRHIVI